MVQIDENVLRFLNGYLGNNDKDAFIRCSDFAYRDMCRTIKFANGYKGDSKKAAANKKKLREAVTILIEKQTQRWINDKTLNEVKFKSEHKNLCEAIIDKYRNTTTQDKHQHSLSFGQAQKWVNMTLKNLYVYSESNTTQLSLQPILQHLQIPIDNVILDIASDQKKCYVDPANISYNVIRPEGVWSDWDYATYKYYQDKLIKKIEATHPKMQPIIWELTHWSTVKD